MGYAPADLRLFLLKQHYRAPLPFEIELLDEAKKIRSKLNNFVHYEMAQRPDDATRPEVEAAVKHARSSFRAALEDDLNTSAALATIHEFMTAMNRAAPGREDAERAIAFMRETDSVIGFLDEPPEQDAGNAEIDALVAERDAARSARDFARADEIRGMLNARGIELLDSPQGTRWRRN
jgi:cysteinyl-tRNA synthetase